MNPNSTHQIWSRWTFMITPVPFVGRPPELEQVKTNAARFAKKAFGCATEMRIARRGFAWVIDVRTEGAPVHDAGFVSYMSTSWRRFLRNGFGQHARVDVCTKLEAGSRQDGTPADQLILAPSIVIEES